MWAWCCRKLYPCCCCWCPWCCFCDGKDSDDIAELITSGERTPMDVNYCTIVKSSSVHVTTSQEDNDSSVDLPGFAKRHFPPGNGGEVLGVSPAQCWSPTLHAVQPDIGTSQESGVTLSTGYNSKSRSRWHRALHTLRPRCNYDNLVSMDRPNEGCGDVCLMAPQITASAPNLNEMDSSQIRKSTKLKVQNSAMYPDVSTVIIGDQQVHWLKSQSMQDINSVRSKSPTSKKVPDETALIYGINTSLYSTSDPMLSKSLEALSAWRTAGEANCYPEPSYGEVQFTVGYEETSKKLFIRVSQVNDLPPKGEYYKYSVVLRLCVLPEERRAKMTCSVSGDLNPSFSEEFRFLVRKLEGRVLRLSVFDADFVGRYDAIGHALFYLEDVPQGERVSYAMKLYKRSQPYQYPGSIEVSLQYDVRQDKLSVHVIQACNLVLTPEVGYNWRSVDNFSTYVKVAYFCAGHKLKSKKSPHVLNSRNPVYEYTSEFVLASNYPHEIYIVITVIVPELLRKDVPVGRLIFGPFNYGDDRRETPWGRVMRHGEVVSHWYNMYL